MSGSMQAVAENVAGVEEMSRIVRDKFYTAQHALTAIVTLSMNFCLAPLEPPYIKRKNLLISLDISTVAGKPLVDMLNPVEDDSRHFIVKRDVTQEKGFYA